MSTVDRQVPMDFFFDDLRNRIQKMNKNNVIVHIGAPGSGKSWAGLRVGEVLDTDFGIRNVVFEASALLDILANEKFKPGSVIVFDEVSGSKEAGYTRRAMSKTNMVLSWTAQTHRSLCYTLIMTCPSYSMLDKDLRSLVDFLLDFKRIDRKTGRAMAWLKYTSANRYSGRIYLKAPRLKDSTGKRIKVKRIWLKKPTAKLIKEYEAKKKAFQHANYKRYAQELKGEQKIRNAKIPFSKLFKKSWKKIGDYTNEKGRVETALLMVELDLSRNNAHLLAKALQLKLDKSHTSKA